MSEYTFFTEVMVRNMSERERVQYGFAEDVYEFEDRIADLEDDLHETRAELTDANDCIAELENKIDNALTALE